VRSWQFKAFTRGNCEITLSRGVLDSKKNLSLFSTFIDGAAQAERFPYPFPGTANVIPAVEISEQGHYFLAGVG
jgi:hypothetical protein